MKRFFLRSFLALGVLISAHAVAATKPCGLSLTTLKLDAEIQGKVESALHKTVNKLIENELNNDNTEWTTAQAKILMKNFIKSYIEITGWNNFEAGAQAKALLLNPSNLKDQIGNILDLYVDGFMSRSLIEQGAYEDKILASITASLDGPL